MRPSTERGPSTEAAARAPKAALSTEGSPSGDAGPSGERGLRAATRARAATRGLERRRGPERRRAGLSGEAGPSGDAGPSGGPSTALRDCVFCSIARGDLAAALVAEEARVVAFLDTRPVFKGHVLVVPRDHVADLAALPPAELAPLFGLAQRVAVALERALGATRARSWR